MERIKQFYNNTGFRGTAHVAILTIIMLIILVGNVSSGMILYTLPTLVVGIALSYFIREILINNARVASIIMNVLLISVLAAKVLGKGYIPKDSIWVDLFYCIFISLYMGSYFLMMSDERVYVER